MLSTVRIRARLAGGRRRYGFPLLLIACVSLAAGLVSCGGDDSPTGTGGGSGTNPPSAPANLQSTNPSSSSIGLVWTDNSNNESGFKIERSASPSSGFSQIGTVGAGVANYLSDGLSTSSTYYYRVRAYNSAGNSAYSNTASGTTTAPPLQPPAAPSNLFASATSQSSIDLSWQDNSNNESGFKIEQSLSPSSGFSPAGNTAAGATNFTRTGLSASTTYYFRVRAYNSVANSTYSNTANATTTAPPLQPPVAPSNLLATATSESSIGLSWQDNSNNEAGFKIWRSLSASSGFSQISAVGAGVTGFTNTGLSASTTYYYRVQAYNGAGNSSFGNTASATTNSPPLTPPGLRVVNDLFDSVAGPNDWGKMNAIIRVRIGPTETAVLNDGSNQYERLWPSDTANDVANTLQIPPNYQQTTSYKDFDVSADAPAYWIYIQTGWWDYFCPSSCYWTKHVSAVMCCDCSTLCYKWATIRVTGHTSGTLTLMASQFLPPGNWCHSTFCGLASPADGPEIHGPVVIDAAARQ